MQFPDRERQQEAYHIRRTELQILDALLRIEEILDRAFPAQPEPVGVMDATPEEAVAATKDVRKRGRK